MQVLADLHFHVIPATFAVNGLDIQNRHLSSLIIRKIVRITKFYVLGLIFLRNYGINQGQQQIFIFLTAEELFKGKINSWIYLAHCLSP